MSMMVIAQQASEAGLPWWQVVLLFLGGPALLFAAIALPVLLLTRRSGPPPFPRLAPGKVQVNGDSRAPTPAPAPSDVASATDRPGRPLEQESPDGR